MPKLVVLDPGGGPRAPPPVEIAASPGDALVDLLDDNDAPVPFSCRSASCGTCRIDVLEGAGLLDAPDEYELDVLDLFGDDPSRRRLACQAKIRSDAVAETCVIRIRAVDD